MRLSVGQASPGRYRLHGFDRVCREHDIEHRPTQPNHAQINGQVEGMNPHAQGCLCPAASLRHPSRLKDHFAIFLTPTTSPRGSSFWRT